MDADEEQVMEIEGLEGIYMDDFEEISSTVPRSFSIRLAPMQEFVQEEEEEDSEGEDFGPLYDGDFAISMTVELPAAYPEELPVLSLVPLSYTIREEETDKLLEQLNVLAEENAGMSMIFVLGTQVQEWLDEKLLGLEEARRLAKRDPALDEVLRLEALRKNGTPVTRESFLEWKEKFDEEMRQQNSEKVSQLREEREAAASSRLTGKQLFEAQPSLALDAAEEVEVDVSLFGGDEDIDDLE